MILCFTPVCGKLDQPQHLSVFINIKLDFLEIWIKNLLIPKNFNTDTAGSSVFPTETKSVLREPAVSQNADEGSGKIIEPDLRLSEIKVDAAFTLPMANELVQR